MTISNFSIAGIAARVSTTVATTINACVNAMRAVVECVSRDDRVHHDPLSETWDWSWLSEVDQ